MPAGSYTYQVNSGKRTEPMTASSANIPIITGFIFSGFTLIAFYFLRL